MEFKIVENIEEAKICDDLLTELIMSERKYDDNVNKSYKVDKYYTEIFDKDYNTLICASCDGIVVGFIDALYVKEKYRNQGIATGLIEEFYKWCELKEIKSVEIDSFIKNKASCKLYKKFGFEITSYRMRKQI